MAGMIKPTGLTAAHMRQANIGQDYWEVSFENYEGPENAKKAAIRYLQRLESTKSKGVGMLFTGPNGPGKTTIMMIIAKYLVRARWDVYCTSLGEIVEGIQKSWNASEDGDREGSFLQRCRGADFLFIDDVGKEHRGQSGFVQTVFDNLIRFRVQHRKPTSLTTNLTKTELEGTYGESVMSLLEGKLLAVTVTGEDHRKTVLKKDNREAMK